MGKLVEMSSFRGRETIYCMNCQKELNVNVEKYVLNKYQEIFCSEKCKEEFEKLLSPPPEDSL